ncbi:isocitrate/isopropylmalate family dehydrogenase [Blautia pseudococcoides]|uniref:isocitrate/isopropylmalate family dehydrogenase n=1 Tax=Blautia pseudococcoides TaxID=1796616 RepID=UPI00148B258A|nr:hypothetical protein HL650_18885 [Blautia pseudococcoides]
MEPEAFGASWSPLVHGSAPDVAGKNVANPAAAVWSASQMLDYLGERRSNPYIDNSNFPCYNTNHK